MPNMIAQITVGINNNQNQQQQQQGDNQNQNRNLPVCTYKGFMACKPKEFHGTTGAVGLLSWFESIESVLHISRCAETDKVEYASCVLHGRALSWWNLVIQTRGREAAYALTWDEFKNLLMREYCSKGEMKKLEAELWNHTMVGNDIDGYTTRFHELARLVPRLVTPEENWIDRYISGLVPEIRGMVISAEPLTIQSAVFLAHRLTSDLLTAPTPVEREEKDKRKADQQPNADDHIKKPKTAHNLAIVATPTTGPRMYTGPHPKCGKCNFHHVGNCPVCRLCNEAGHYPWCCQEETGGKRKKSVCYKCGSDKHLRKSCPKLRNAKPNQAGQGRGRAP